MTAMSRGAAYSTDAIRLLLDHAMETSQTVSLRVVALDGNDYFAVGRPISMTPDDVVIEDQPTTPIRISAIAVAVLISSLKERG